jgi:hypothetical protein
MTSALALDAPTERVAVNLLRHLEWQDAGFSLVFCSPTSVPRCSSPTGSTSGWRCRAGPCSASEASDSFVRHPEAAVDELVGRFAELSAQAGGVWYALQRHPATSSGIVPARCFSRVSTNAASCSNAT